MVSIDEIIAEIDFKIFDEKIEEIQTDEDIKTDLKHVLRFVPLTKRKETQKIIYENSETILEVIADVRNVPFSDYSRIAHIWRNYLDIYLGVLTKLIEQDHKKKEFFIYNVCQFSQEQFQELILRKGKSKVPLLERVGYQPIN